MVYLVLFFNPLLFGCQNIEGAIALPPPVPTAIHINMSSIFYFKYFVQSCLINLSDERLFANCDRGMFWVILFFYFGL